MVIKITIICLGKFKEKAFVELEKEYLKRLGVFTKLKIKELPEVSYKTNSDIPAAKKKEAELVRGNIPKDSVIVILEERGVLRNSLDFASFIERIASFGREITFVIGSGVGLDESLRELSHHSISLSQLTFTHNFARVLLEEQIYRALCIMTGKEYHK